jgi:hypothetical protein
LSENFTDREIAHAVKLCLTIHEARRATKTASHTRLQEIRARKEELAVAQAERELVPLVEA